MNRIDDLIAELCPDGVEFRALGEVGEFVRGNGIQKKNLTDFGVGAIHYGQIYTHYGIWATETKSFVTPELAEPRRKASCGDLVIATTSENDEDVCKAVAWLGKDDVVISGDAYIYSHSLEPKYVAYFFQSEQFQLQKIRYITGAKVRRVSGGNMAKIRIPVPPLEVQREIVKILDNFTELEARRRQYQYYRDVLLSFDDASVTSASKQASIRWTTLGEIAINLDSKRRPVTKSAREGGDIPYYGASGIVDYVSDYIFNGDYLLVSEDGANLLARSTPIAFSISGKTWVNNHAHVLQFNSYAERRFVEFYLNSINLSPFISGGAQPKLNKTNLNKIPIPAPSIEEQARIVTILDQFDALVNDLSSGLPAEINARRRQYEYYRDRLLSFREAA